MIRDVLDLLAMLLIPSTVVAFLGWFAADWLGADHEVRLVVATQSPVVFILILWVLAIWLRTRREE